MKTQRSWETDMCSHGLIGLHDNKFSVLFWIIHHCRRHIHNFYEYDSSKCPFMPRPRVYMYKEGRRDG